MIDIFKLEEDFVSENLFTTRYVAPRKLYNFLLSNYKSSIEKIGSSVMDKPIYKITIGKGAKQVLLWTQMHGNETTGTLSVLDLLKFLEANTLLAKTILKELTLDIVFMLNPDGAELWSRRNIMNVDMNRDYIAEASPEIRLLKEIILTKEYNLAFNLHDQRTIYGVDKTLKPATLSFLSPSVSYDRAVTETRKKSMGLISDIYREISQILPNQIGRYSDEYYPRSVGDNFQKIGIPTILFEGGHYPNDYYRQETRKYFSLALITALYYASIKKEWENNYESYFSIPENNSSFYDIIFRNVKLLSDDKASIVDIAIQYTEQISPKEEEISFIAKIEEIGDLSACLAHKDIDAEHRLFISKEYIFPYIEMIADFKLDEWTVVNGRKLELFTQM